MQGYSQAEKEWVMGEYLRLKRSTGWNNERLARHLGVNPGTLYKWKNQEWYEDVKRNVLYQENAEIAAGALNKLNDLIHNEDSEVSLKALNVFARLNPDIGLNISPSGKDKNIDNNVFDSSEFRRNRFEMGDEDE